MKSFLVMLGLLLPVTAIANITVHGEVARIYPSGNAVHFKLKNDQCGNTGQYYYFLLGSEVEKAWYSRATVGFVGGADGRQTRDGILQRCSV